MMFGKNPGTDKTATLIPEGSIGAELGVWKGDSSAKFIKRAKHIHLVDSWTVEAYQGSKEHGGYDAYLKRYSELVGSDNPNDFQKYYDKIYQSVVDRFANHSVTIHRMPTEHWFDTFTEKLDWIYVDASHSYDGCLNDLRKSWNMIKQGGYLLCDDYSEKKLDVKNAITDFAKEKDLTIDNFYMDQVKFVKEF